jgi:hypothetical protein
MAACSRSATVFIRLLEKSATAVMAILRTEWSLRQNEAMLRQSEKWLSGTLSAGLAHELNNPASPGKADRSVETQ